MLTNQKILTTQNQLLILLLVALGLNINTLFNEYAVDDKTVITNNSFVQKGIKGIPEILTQGYFKGEESPNPGEFSGGRYRPIALIVFALEYQLFGANPFVSHLINVIIFALLIGMLFTLLQRHIFKERHPYLAFVTCLLFATHPIHTEVIANVKSRDELITFLLLISSLIFLLKHIVKKQAWLLVTGSIFFFLALLTRESAVTFILIFPLISYFFLNQSVKKSILSSIPLIVVLVFYFLLRFRIVGLPYSNITDITNAPFLLATPSQAFATKFFILLKYLGLLIFPHPLSWEYGYNQIPYIDLLSFKFIFSLSVMTILMCYALYEFKKKSIFSFCILYFIVSIFLVSNFIADTGTPLAERFLFQPSLAFCIAFSYIYIIAEKKSKAIANISLLIILVLFSIKTFLRNGEWKNDDTIGFADIKTSPNSIRANMAVSYLYLSKSNNETNVEISKDYLKKAAYYSECALKIYPMNPRASFDKAFACFKLFYYYDSVDLWLKECNLNPAEPNDQKIIKDLSTDLYAKGNENLYKKNFDLAILFYQKSIALNKNQTEAWYNLGGVYFIKQDTVNALIAWEKVKSLNPGHSLKKRRLFKH